MNIFIFTVDVLSYHLIFSSAPFSFQEKVPLDSSYMGDWSNAPAVGSPGDLFFFRRLDAAPLQPACNLPAGFNRCAVAGLGNLWVHPCPMSSR